MNVTEVSVMSAKVSFVYDGKKIIFEKVDGKLKVISISKLIGETTHPIRFKKEIFKKFCKAAGVLLR